jgi:predicted dehydrogenase
MNKLLPAVQKSTRNRVTAIASRDLARAATAATQLGAPKWYGSYEELLADPEIDVVYNPLPNHLHVAWSVRAAEAGKHVLCEKPVSLNAGEVDVLIEAMRRTGVVIMEAFMVRTHPQWLRAREIVRSGELGQLRTLLAAFSYHNVDGANIRNKADIGGGALYDIGCYAIQWMRFVTGEEPARAVALLDRDSGFGTDRLVSAMLDFPSAQGLLTVSTQSVPYQRFQVLGTRGRVELEIPVNAPPDRATRLLTDLGGALDGSTIRVEEFGPLDQYTIQADEFARAVRGERAPAVSLADSMANMRVIGAIFRSGESGGWVPVL